MIYMNFAVAFDSATRTHRMTRKDAAAYLVAAIRTHPGAHIIRLDRTTGEWVAA